MFKYFLADYVLPVTDAPIRDGVVVVNDEGVIEEVLNRSDIPANVEVIKLNGTLVPGFVNAHCHLELSHMKGVIPREIGLTNFIEQVMANRGLASEDEVNKAMKSADEMMYNAGIQAVGDHVNSMISAKVKEQSKMTYHTFVEVMGMQEELAEQKIDEAREIEFHFDVNHTSITPHAPYSCSKSLMKLFKKSVSESNILSVHNQESEEENKLFRYKTGKFLDFYDKMGIDHSGFKAQARNSIQSYLGYLPLGNRLMLVHNTYTTIKDLDFLNRMGRQVIFCLCPNANIYIEDKLPKVSTLKHNEDIVIGTDSLASNSTLSILDELKTLHRFFPELDVATTIKWATYNGAKALNLEDTIGSIERGKKPGLVLLKKMKQLRLTEDIELERIV